VNQLLAILSLGFFLGMRHATDPDHVVAVSTIASRERSVGQGAMIGVLWGVGHTLTIFIVGSAIILFGLTIPPRVGLSMEFTVALMLILLGVLNLTGALRWLAGRFGPAERGTRIENSLGGFVARNGKFQVFRPLLIGLVHGLAGSAAVALLVNALPFSRTGAIRPTLEHCAWLVDPGWSVLLYPQGTRSVDGRLGPFKDGAGLLAVELGVPVVPVPGPASTSGGPPSWVTASDGPPIAGVGVAGEAKSFPAHA